MTNSAFGTMFGVVDVRAFPVRDHAGFAPFGSGYRRCPGEQFTIQVFEELSGSRSQDICAIDY
jgi:hypothetical protein